MKLRQLRYVMEVHRQGNHISAAADALHTSQPGMSKQIQLLEAELGFRIFQRRKNKVVGVTEPGQEVISIVQRIMNDVQDLGAIREDFSLKENGRLTVATTHTYARYVLPRIVDGFLKRYPRIDVSIWQGNPTQICEAVEMGDADLAVGTETTRAFPGLVMLPSLKITRSVIAKKNHPILTGRRLTLAEIAKYPIITHDPGRSGRWKVMGAFEKEGIKPRVVFSAVDADVSKIYVELGLGIAILATVAVDPLHDSELGAKDAGHLFEPSTTYVSVRRNAYLRKFVFDFIEALDYRLSPETVGAAVQQKGEGSLSRLQLLDSGKRVSSRHKDKAYEGEQTVREIRVRMEASNSYAGRLAQYSAR